MNYFCHQCRLYFTTAEKHYKHTIENRHRFHYISRVLDNARRLSGRLNGHKGMVHYIENEEHIRFLVRNLIRCLQNIDEYIDLNTEAEIDEAEIDEDKSGGSDGSGSDEDESGGDESSGDEVVINQPTTIKAEN